MRVLLDECVPKKFGRELVGHYARTAPQLGWAGKRNGALLNLMLAAGFEVFVTVDRGIPHQQNLQAAGVAVLLLVGRSNKLADLLPLIADALAALTTIQPGDVVEVHTP